MVVVEAAAEVAVVVKAKVEAAAAKGMIADIGIEPYMFLRHM